jgi:hypothetical protein
MGNVQAAQTLHFHQKALNLAISNMVLLTILLVEIGLFLKMDLAALIRQLGQEQIMEFMLILVVQLVLKINVQLTFGEILNVRPVTKDYNLY